MILVRRKIGKWLLIGFFIILIDIIIYFALGIGLMAYDDFYTGPEEDYLSWHTLDAFDKKVYVALMIWNFLNLLGLVFIVFKIFKYLKQNWNYPYQKTG